MFSLAPSPSTRPISTSALSRWVSTAMPLWVRPSVFHGGSCVVATRRSPSSSDIDHWLSRYPAVSPDAAYVVVVGSLVSKECSSVATLPLGVDAGDHREVAMNRWSVEA